MSDRDRSLKAHLAAVRATENISEAILEGNPSSTGFALSISREYKPLEDAARDAADCDWGGSVSEEYHNQRIAKMERMRAALKEVCGE